MVGLLLAVGSALTIAPQAMADAEEDDFNRAGAYLGGRVLGGSYGRYDDRLISRLDVDAMGNSEDVDHDAQLGFDIYAGYRLHKNLAVEGEFEMMPSAKIKATSGTLVELESWVLSGAVKAILPFGGLQPYVSAGVGYMEVDVKDRRELGFGDNDGGVVGRAGGGIDVYLTKHVVLNVAIDYIIPSSDLGDYDYLSFGGGIQYRF